MFVLHFRWMASILLTIQSTKRIKNRICQLHQIKMRRHQINALKVPQNTRWMTLKKLRSNTKMVKKSKKKQLDVPSHEAKQSNEMNGQWAKNSISIYVILFSLYRFNAWSVKIHLQDNVTLYFLIRSICVRTQQIRTANTWSVKQLIHIFVIRNCASKQIMIANANNGNDSNPEQFQIDTAKSEKFA